MGKRNWKEWAKAALIRALRTFAQTFVGSIAVGAAFSEIDWIRVCSVAGTSFVLSIMTSLAGLPETPDEPAEDITDKMLEKIIDEEE